MQLSDGVNVASFSFSLHSLMELRGHTNTKVKFPVLQSCCLENKTAKIG